LTLTLLLTLWACSDDSDDTGPFDSATTDEECVPVDEVCDGLDNDCDGETDEPGAVDALTFYADVDQDGYGDAQVSVLACEEPPGFASVAGDCDDEADGVNPDASEVCDGADNDCDGLVDDDDDSLDPATGTTVFLDLDGDGYGDPASEAVYCEVPVEGIEDGSDCDDADASVYPGAPEVCDGQQTDCADDTWTSDAGRADFIADADGTWTDLSATFAAGSRIQPVEWTLSEPGTLSICEGTWHLVLSVEASGAVVGADGASAVVLNGGDDYTPILVAGVEAAVADLTLTEGYATHTIVLGDDSRTYGGAALCTGGGSLTLSGVVLSDNVATGLGGAVGAEDCTLVLDGVTATGNEAYGGGVVAALESAVSVVDSAFSANLAQGEGGTFYLGGGATLDVTGSRFDGETASIGGAIRGEVRSGRATNDVSLVDSHLEACTALEGGAVAVEDGGELELTGTTFVDHFAYELGGAVYADVDRLDVEGTTFEGNLALDDGGAIYVEAAEVWLLTTDFATNSAEDGGALWAETAAGSIDTCTFEGNAASRGGGAISVMDGGDVLEIVASDFTDNTAVRDGGALSSADGAQVSLDGCTFTGNSTDNSGGAVASVVADLAVVDTTFDGNTAGAGESGGGLYVYNGALSAERVAWTGNSLDGEGGGLAVQLALAELTDCAFTDNSAEVGGAVHMGLSLVDVATTDFSGNAPDDTYVDEVEESATWGAGASFSCSTAGCE